MNGETSYDIYSVIAGNLKTDKIYESYNLTFRQADKIFESLKKSREYPVIVLYEGDISIRGIGSERGEEKEPRYEVLCRHEKQSKDKDGSFNKDIQVRDNYTFYEDSGHGWLEVPLQELKDFGIQERITSFSFLYKEMAYLEEDVDAGTFLDIRNKLPKKAEIHTHYIGGMCYIREFPQYKPGDIQPDKDNPARIFKKTTGEVKVVIARFINDVSINGLEYLLGENGKAKEFNNKEEAVLFLRNHGVYDKDIGHFKFNRVDTDNERPTPSQNSSKRKRHDLNDDRGR
jgi:hypothetical protein